MTGSGVGPLNLIEHFSDQAVDAWFWNLDTHLTGDSTTAYRITRSMMQEEFKSAEKYVDS